MEATTADRDRVRGAIQRLPERQRVALELREGKELSYEQIAAALGTGADSVAQLIERARINLYDELRGTALASVAAPSAECERALPLIAARQDGELTASSEDASWLDGHLPACDRCRLAEVQMGAAADLYRGEAPRPTVAPVDASAAGAAAPPRRRRPSRRRLMLAAGLAGLALAIAAIVLAAGGGSSDPATVSADAAAKPRAAQAISAARVAAEGGNARSGARDASRGRTTATGAATERAGVGGFAAPPIYGSGGGDGTDGATEDSAARSHGSPGKAAVQPAKQKSTPRSRPKQKPPSSTAQAPQPTAQPASQPAPSPSGETAQPAEEADRPGRSGEAPGKPADHPPHK